MTAAVRKQKVITLEERVLALSDELEAALEELAEARRNRGELKEDCRGELVIAGALSPAMMRMEFERQGRKQFPGECYCKSYQAAIKT